MNKQKLIMESWRRFLKENQQGRIYLYHRMAGKYHHIILYTIGDTKSAQDIFFTLKEIGAVGFMKTRSPCIPKTYDISNIHTNDEFKKQGYGTMLYDFAMVLAQSFGGGLTSDRSSGSLMGAAIAWDRIEANTSKYGKRKTEVVPIAHDSENAPEDAVPAFLLRPQPEPGATTVGGNDKFDYYGETPDPDDDCSRSKYGGNATNHSFYLLNPSEFEAKFSEFQGNHDGIIEFLENEESDDFSADRFLRVLRDMSDDNFSDQYDRADK